MAGLLSGLSSLGLGDLENVDLFAEPEKETDHSSDQANTAPKIAEQELIYDKNIICPLCDYKFVSKTVKAGKTPLIETDMDMRPKYEGIDIIKYDVIACPKCGFAALTRFHKPVSTVQRKAIEEHISRNFRYTPPKTEIYTYEDALERYKLALANAVVKHGKASEKAYTCLKAGWLLRGALENLNPKDADYDVKKAEYEASEDEFLKNAMEGFIAALQSETLPICGMDEATIKYLVAVLAIRFDKLDIASKLVSGLLVSAGTSKRIKDKCLDLKNSIVQKIKDKNGK